MTARITVSVLSELLGRSQAVTNANREKLLEREAEQRARAKQLAAKKRNQEAARRRGGLDDPTGQNIFTAPAVLGDATIYPGYFKVEIGLTTVTQTLRSGVKATAPTEFYDDVANGGYANQGASIVFPRASVDTSVFSLASNTEYAEALAEVGTPIGTIDEFNVTDPLEAEGWYAWSIGSDEDFRFFAIIGGAYRLTRIIEPQVDRSDPAFTQVINSFSLTSNRLQDGTILPPGRFVYAVGRKEEQSFVSGTFSGFVRYRDFSWSFNGITMMWESTMTRDESVPATGGWAGESDVAGPVTGAWIIAESSRVPSSQSVVAAGVGGLDLDAAFAGDLSSWPGVSSGGTMIQLQPAGGGGGGGGGGGE